MNINMKIILFAFTVAAILVLVNALAGNELDFTPSIPDWFRR